MPSEGTLLGATYRVEEQGEKPGESIVCDLRNGARRRLGFISGEEAIFHRLTDLRHPNVEAILSVGRDQEHGPFYITPCHERVAIRELSLQTNDLLLLGYQLFCALDFLHHHGIARLTLSLDEVHRAKDSDHPSFQLSARSFHAGSLSPEGEPAELNENSDGSEDLERAGQLLYRLMTGVTPNRTRIIPIRRRNPRIAAAFATLVEATVEGRPRVHGWECRDIGAKWLHALLERDDSMVLAHRISLMGRAFRNDPRILSIVQGLIDRAAGGEARLLTIRAGQGNGSSALLQKIATLGERKGFLALSLTAESPIGLPLRGVRHLLATLAECSGDRTHSPMSTQFEGNVLIGKESSTLQETRVRIAEDVRRRLGRAAWAGLLLLIDDAHNVDTASLRILSGLIREDLRKEPILAVVVQKEEFAGQDVDAIFRSPPFDAVTLGPHPTERLATMYHFLTLPDVLHSELTERFDRICRGRILYFNQYMIDFLESRSFESVLNGELTGIKQYADSIPETIRHMLESKLPGLSKEEQEVLHAASVLNSEFSSAHLSRFFGYPKADERCRSLSRKGWLEPTDNGYAFPNRVIKAFLYERIEIGERRSFHRLILNEVQDEGEPSVLFRHALGSEDAEAASRYAFRLAEQNLESGIHDEALRPLRALASADLHLSPRQEAQLDFLRGRALMGLGRFEEATEMLQRALSKEESAKARLFLAQSCAQQGQYRHSLETIASREDQISQGDLPTRVSFFYLKGENLWQLGEINHAVEAFREGMEMARGASATLRAVGESYLGAVFSRTGRLDEAADLLSSALSVLDQAGEGGFKALTLSRLGFLAKQRGDHEQSGFYHEQSLELYQTLGDRANEAGELIDIANLHRESRQFEKALSMLREAVEIATSVGDKSREDLARSNMAAVYGDLGYWDRSVELFEQALEADRKIGNREYEAIDLFWLGSLASRREQFERADGMLREARRCFQELEHRQYLGEAVLALAQNALAWRQISQCRGFIEEALAVNPTLRTHDAVRLLKAELALHEKRLDKAERLLDGMPPEIDFELHVRRELTKIHVLAERGEREGAFRSLEKLRALLENDEEIYYSSRAALLALGRFSPPERLSEARGELETLREQLSQLQIPSFHEQSRQIERQLKNVGGVQEQRLTQRSLTQLLRISSLMNELEFPNCQSEALKLVREGVDAHHAALIERGDAGQLTLLEARSEDGRVDRMELCWPLIEEVGKSGSSLFVTEVEREKKWAEEESIVLNRLGSLLAVPLRVGSDIEGMLYVDRTKLAPPFSLVDRLFLQSVAKFAGPGVRNRRLLSSHRRHLDRLQHEVASPYQFDSILGECPAMSKVFAELSRVIDTEVTVLIVGESGTGKELVARAIHYKGSRRARPFCAINCTELTDSLLESELFGHVKGAFTGAEVDRIGLLEGAEGGTCFLDEVGDLTLRAQTKLLRVLQEKEIRPVGSNSSRPVNVRFISATHRDLRTAVEKGDFREDLFYRLNVVTIQLPPLRERGEDVVLLVQHFLRLYAKDMKRESEDFSPEALDMLCRYHWPGNIRELQNVVQTLLVHHGEERILAADTLPEHIRQPIETMQERGLKQSLAAHEQQILQQSLLRHGGNKSQAARALGISRQTLLKKLKKYDLVSQ